MIKTIWNSGDIITSEKWNKINDNLSVLGAYKLPATIDNNGSIIINKSYNEIYELLNKGVICYFIEEYNDSSYYSLAVNIITKFNNYYQTIYDQWNREFIISNSNSNQMVYFNQTAT